MTVHVQARQTYCNRILICAFFNLPIHQLLKHSLWGEGEGEREGERERERERERGQLLM